MVEFLICTSQPLISYILTVWLLQEPENFSHPPKNVIILKFEESFYLTVKCPKDTDGVAKSICLDQTVLNIWDDYAILLNKKMTLVNPIKF